MHGGHGLSQRLRGRTDADFVRWMTRRQPLWLPQLTDKTLSGKSRAGLRGRFSHSETMHSDQLSYVETQSPSLNSFYLPLAVRTLKNLQTCLQWAWLDTVCHYRRSRIGPFWETINMMVTILGLALVSSALFGGEMGSVIGYIGLGLIIWSAISALVMEGSTAFIRNADLITSTTVSIDIYIGRTVFRTLIIFCHHVVLYFIGLALLIVPLTWESLLAIPGLLLLFVNGYWVGVVLAFICARFRDVEQIVRNLMQLAFFMTPIFWNADIVSGRRRAIVDYNILYYFIDIVRSPLLGRIPPLEHYLVVIAFTVIGYGLAVLTYRTFRRQLAFFV